MEDGNGQKICRKGKQRGQHGRKRRMKWRKLISEENLYRGMGIYKTPMREKMRNNKGMVSNDVKLISVETSTVDKSNPASNGNGKISSIVQVPEKESKMPTIEAKVKQKKKLIHSEGASCGDKTTGTISGMTIGTSGIQTIGTLDGTDDLSLLSDLSSFFARNCKDSKENKGMELMKDVLKREGYEKEAEHIQDTSKCVFAEEVKKMEAEFMERFSGTFGASALQTMPTIEQVKVNQEDSYNKQIKKMIHSDSASCGDKTTGTCSGMTIGTFDVQTIGTFDGTDDMSLLSDGCQSKKMDGIRTSSPLSLSDETLLRLLLSSELSDCSTFIQPV